MRISALSLLVLGVATLGTTGCDFKTDWSRWLDPSKTFRTPSDNRSPVMPILPTVTMAEQNDELPPNVTFPREGDWTYSDKDYVLGPRDIMDISILDLFQEGLETVLRRQVTDSGNIDLPLLSEPIPVEGLTQAEVKAALVKAYSPDILRNPTISITIQSRRQSTFSILGGIARPGTYEITRRDMRLLEALANAGGRTQTNIKYVLVIRPAPATRYSEPGRPTKTPGAIELPPLPELPSNPLTTAPRASAPATTPKTDKATAEILKELGGALTAPTTKPAPRPATLVQLTETAQTGGAPADPAFRAKVPKWVYRNGQWMRVEQDAPLATQPSGAGTPPVAPAYPSTAQAISEPTSQQYDPYGWRKANRTDLARIVAINVSKLEAGDPRMNIIIRDNDVVLIPVLEVGEFYVMGEVLRPGVYSLTGRKVTVKMALAAAGNLGPLAWPDNSILIRRVGENQEQIIPLNLEAISRGNDPDLYLKPNDVIAVGTHLSAPFLAVMRNAFRMTYGFGFIYDRNFADPLIGTPDQRRFTEW